MSAEAIHKVHQYGERLEFVEELWSVELKNNLQNKPPLQSYDNQVAEQRAEALPWFPLWCLVPAPTGDRNPINSAFGPAAAAAQQPAASSRPSVTLECK